MNDLFVARPIPSRGLDADLRDIQSRVEEVSETSVVTIEVDEALKTAQTVSEGVWRSQFPINLVPYPRISSLRGGRPNCLADVALVQVDQQRT